MFSLPCLSSSYGEDAAVHLLVECKVHSSQIWTPTGLGSSNA